jgi:hypothetical protein
MTIGWRSWLDFRLHRPYARPRTLPSRRSRVEAAAFTFPTFTASVRRPLLAAALKGMVRVSASVRTVNRRRAGRWLSRVKASDDTRQVRKASLFMSVTSALLMYRGEDHQIDFDLRADSIPADGIAGWVIHFNMVRCDADGVPVSGAAKLGVIIASITDAALGKFRVIIPSAYTASAEVGLYKWDARRQPSGQKATLADGTMRVLPEVAV